MNANQVSGGREFAPRGPVEIGNFLGAKSQELDQIQNQLQQAHEVFEDAELEWERHYDEVVDQLEEEAEGGKLPGEDVRISTARRRGGWEKWSNYRRADRTIRRLRVRASMVENAISAAQSEAKLVVAVEPFSPRQK